MIKEGDRVEVRRPNGERIRGVAVRELRHLAIFGRFFQVADGARSIGTYHENDLIPLDGREEAAGVSDTNG